MPEELLERVRKKADKIPTWAVYYGLRDYGMTRIKQPTTDLTKECLALHYLGLPITVPMLEYVHDPSSNIYNLIHRLGDNKVLTLIKDGRRVLRYLINPRFLDILKLPEELDERRSYE